MDLSTGEFRATEFSGSRRRRYISATNCSSCVPAKSFFPAPTTLLYRQATSAELDGAGGVETRLEDWVFQRDYAERILREQFGVLDWKALA